MGAQLVKEVATKTNDIAGDGTTTATVLAQALVREGLRNVAAGANPMGLKKGMEKAVSAAVENLAGQAVQVDDSKDKIAQVASISAADTLDRRGHRQRDRQGRQGRRRHRRGVEHLRHGPRLRRGHAVRQGLPVALLRHRRRAPGGRARRAVHPVQPGQDLERAGSPAGAREGHAVGQAAADHRRGHRGRSPRHARGQQDPRHVQLGRRQGAGLRRAPQGDAAGHGHPHRWPGHRRGGRPQARLRST